MIHEGDLDIHGKELAQHAGFARSIARAILSREDLADDAVQDAFAVAWGSRPRNEGRLRSWFGGIVRHKALDIRRREATRLAREHAAEAQRDSDDPAAVAERADMGRRVVEQVLALPEAHRHVLLLRFHSGRTVQEVATLLDVPVETVRTRQRRALAQLRVAFDTRDGGARPSLALLAVSWTQAEPTTPATIVGGLLMGKKVAAVACALLILSGAAWWMANDNDAVSVEEGTPVAEHTLALDGPPVLNEPSLEPRARRALPQVLAAALDINPPPPPEEVVAVEILDIATREPVVGVQVKIKVGAAINPNREFVTDARGVVEVPRGLAAISLSSDTWKLIRPTKADLKADRPTLYAHRQIRVNVTCRFADAASLPPGTSVGVAVLRPLDARLTKGTTAYSAGGQHWLSARGARRDDYTASLSEALTLRFVTRLLPSQGFTLKADGFWSDIAEIPSNWPVRRSQPEVNVSVVLHAGYCLKGTVLDQDGRPLANRRVSLIVLRRLPVSEATTARCKVQGASLTIRGANKKSPLARVQTMTVAKTGADGSYSISSAVDGEALLYVHERGFGPGHTRFDSLRGVNGQTDITLRRGEGAPSARLTWRGQPLSPGSLMVVTMSGDPQYHFDLQVQKDGVISTEWFRPDMDYYIHYWARTGSGRFNSSARGVFHWHGQAEQQLEGLTHATVGLHEVPAGR